MDEQTRERLTKLNKIVAEIYREAYKGNEFDQIKELKILCESWLNSQQK